MFWISAAAMLAAVVATACAAPAYAAAADADRDGIPTTWELRHKLSPRSSADAKRDFDTDGLSNLLEYRLRGLPRDEDTDNDGQDDGDERTTRTGSITVTPTTTVCATAPRTTTRTGFATRTRTTPTTIRADATAATTARTNRVSPRRSSCSDPDLPVVGDRTATPPGVTTGSPTGRISR